MEAGRELDALIAEKVMGWHKGLCGECKNRPWLANDYLCSYWHDQNGKDTQNPINDIWTGGMSDNLEAKAWSPSTDIKAAWEVVEKMLENKYFREGFDLTVTEPPGWTCNFGDDNTRSYAETAPHAICVAAIKAKGFEHDLWVATQD